MSQSNIAMFEELCGRRLMQRSGEPRESAKLISFLHALSNEDLNSLISHYVEEMSMIGTYQTDKTNLLLMEYARRNSRLSMIEKIKNKLGIWWDGKKETA